MKIKNWRDIEDGERALADLDSVPPRIRMDYETRNKNLQAGKILCSWCDGTGNELNKFFASYRRCPKCYEAGVQVQ